MDEIFRLNTSKEIEWFKMSRNRAAADAIWQRKLAKLK
jgi:hypothetical protein